jgi:protein subunit release factor B
LEILKAKLTRLRATEKEAEAARLRKAVPKAAFGNAYRRTYVLSQHPGIHNHVTGKKTTQVQDVLNGCLEDLAR